MSILDQFKDLLDGDDAKGQGGLLKSAQDLLGGGLDGVKKQFEDSGLGEKFKSWTGQGDNEPATPEEIKKAFGDEKLKELADREGTDPDSLAEKLAAFFPQLIDKVTPKGEDGADANIVDTMKGLLGKIPGL